MKELPDALSGIEHYAKPCLSTWSKLFSCRPSYLFVPKDEDEIQTVFHWCRENDQKVRIIGGLCMENNLWCPDGNQEESHTVAVSSAKFNKILDVDSQKKIVHAQAGILIDDLNEQLASSPYNLALPTQGAQVSVSLVGAFSTCTKGTGLDYQCLTSYVKEFSIIVSDGSTRTIVRAENEELFNNILCGMGCFGMITSIKIQCVELEQLSDTTESTTMSNVLTNFSNIVHSAERVRIWWVPLDGRACISRISKTSLPRSASSQHSWFRRRLIGYYLHQLLLYICVWFPFLTPYTVRLLYSLTREIPQQRIGQQKDILPMDCLYSQRTSEWSIPFDGAVNALNDLNKVFTRNAPLEMNGMVEIRFVKSDRFPLSPACSAHDNQIFVDIGLVQYCPFRTTEPYLPFESILTQFCTICQRYGGRFHWSKEISSDVKDIDDIKRLWNNKNRQIDTWIQTRNEMDPHAMFWTSKFANLLGKE